MLGVDAQLKGVQQAHRELALLDSAIRKELRKEAKKIVRPLVQEAQSMYPRTEKKKTPLKGVNYSWARIAGDGFPYNQARAKRGVRFTCDISRKDRTVFRVRQIDAAAAVLENVGKGHPNPLGKAVAFRYGMKNRFMWEAATKKMPAVRRELQTAIIALVYGINRKNERDAR